MNVFRQWLLGKTDKFSHLFGRDGQGVGTDIKLLRF
jgi:hypothetical protein